MSLWIAATAWRRLAATGISNFTGEVESDAMRRAVQTNLLGPFWVCRAFAPGMIRSGYGRIVNVSSELGAFAGGLGGPAGYSVTKAAAVAFAESVAIEHGDKGIGVSVLCPQAVRTNMTAGSEGGGVAGTIQCGGRAAGRRGSGTWRWWADEGGRSTDPG